MREERGRRPADDLVVRCRLSASTTYTDDGYSPSIALGAVASPQTTMVRPMPFERSLSPNGSVVRPDDTL
jgi:hypothetical protein